MADMQAGASRARHPRLADASHASSIPARLQKAGKRAHQLLSITGAVILESMKARIEMLHYLDVDVKVESHQMVSFGELYAVS